MSTNLPKEYELAQRIIDEFKSDRHPLDLEGRILDWKVLSSEERAHLDRRLNLDCTREAALRYQERAEARQKGVTQQ